MRTAGVHTVACRRGLSPRLETARLWLGLLRGCLAVCSSGHCYSPSLGKSVVLCMVDGCMSPPLRHIQMAALPSTHLKHTYDTSMGVLIVMDIVHAVVNDSRGLATNETAWRHPPAAGGLFCWQLVTCGGLVLTEASITAAERQRTDSAATAMHYPYVSNVSTPLALRSVGESRWQTRQAKETQAMCKGLGSVGATVDI
jgi:hypothetical protein